MIGWNRSAQAARAVHAALPMLERAGDVVILSVETGAKRGPSAEQMARYLAWHEVKAEVREFAPDNRSVGEVLLAEAEAAECDLLVTGAYSHSRLRDLLLGGVTRHVLAEADIPVLLAR